MTPRSFRPALPLCATLLFSNALLVSARAEDAPEKAPEAAAAPAKIAVDGSELVSIVERLRRERARLAGESLLPAPLLVGAAGRTGILGGPISSAISTEREAENASPLPDSWQLSGEGEKEDAAGNARTAQKWRLGLDVPLQHWWGSATLKAKFERSEGGAAREASASTAGLEHSGGVSLRQELKLGALQGSAQVALEGSEQRADLIYSSGERGRRNRVEGDARLKWQLRPGLAISASHASKSEKSTTLSPLENEEDAEDALDSRSESEAGASDALAALHERDVKWAVEGEANRRAASELGLEWKWSRSLSLSAQASSTRSERGAWSGPLGEDREIGIIPGWARDEERAALALQKRTGGGSWGLKWSRSWARAEREREEGAEVSEDKRRDALSLQAERRLASWLSLRGSWKLSGETNFLSARAQEAANREAEARLDAGLGRLSLRYSDLASRSLGAGAEDGGSREYGVRYDLGRDEGLGLSVEYSQRAEREKSTPATSNWRLGVTYR